MVVSREYIQESTHSNSLLRLNGISEMIGWVSYEKHYTMIFFGLKEVEERGKTQVAHHHPNFFFYLLCVKFSIPFISCMSLSSRVLDSSLILSPFISL